MESTIVIQRFQQILSGSLQYSCKGRFTFSLGNLWVFLGSFEGILGVFPPFFFSKSAGPRLSQGAGNGNSEVGVGELWREREGNSPPDPGVTPRSPNLDLRGALWKRTTEFFGTLCSPHTYSPLPTHTHTHTHTFIKTHTFLSF